MVESYTFDQTTIDEQGNTQHLSRVEITLHGSAAEGAWGMSYKLITPQNYSVRDNSRKRKYTEIERLPVHFSF
jgi:hypothetical protein